MPLTKLRALQTSDALPVTSSATKAQAQAPVKPVKKPSLNHSNSGDPNSFLISGFVSEQNHLLLLYSNACSGLPKSIWWQCTVAIVLPACPSSRLAHPIQPGSCSLVYKIEPSSTRWMPTSSPQSRQTIDDESLLVHQTSSLLLSSHSS